MAQSLARLWTHLIFSTKDRFPFLTDKVIRREMHAYLAEMLRKQNCETLIVGGVEDHTHSLFALSRTHPIADVVKEVKRTSCGWIKEASGKLSRFSTHMVSSLMKGTFGISYKRTPFRVECLFFIAMPGDGRRRRE